ncbi:hypothetical protein PR202_gb14923 [Eleusine coracana subsp. coracana]|uniref:Uncharacterized protein n=1 Tax=Eleusine coracana subsp. coracana TaxID=191504 RepID=A0AAV5EU85_ELECO|nr:hypothetical protein PR202_gb14923 [Eleusine coracana subsp. coracana]
MADLVLGVAKSLVDGTLSKAQSAIEEETRLRASTQRDLVFIAGEFHMMQSFLGITNEEHVKNGVVSTWVTQVRDLAYDVEDCIEFVLHLDKKPDWWRRFISCSFCNCAAKALPLDEAVADIEQLKARVEDVSRRNARYNQIIGDPGVITQQTTPQAPASGAGASSSFDLLAEEGKQQDVLTKLIIKEGSTDLQVISVWATGAGEGAPSTTIVKKAYDDPRIRSTFRCRAYVKLAHPFNLHKFIRTLLDQFYANSSEQEHGAIRHADVLKRMKAVIVADEDLVKDFMDHVEKQNFLVVLQDLSSMAEWDVIRMYFPDRSKGSRIVVSTQEFEVASFCVGPPYVQWFSADHSLCIFFKKVYRKELMFNVKSLELTAAIDLFKKEVQKINPTFSMDIVDNDVVLNQLIPKCGGLPRVIVATADFLFQILFEWPQRSGIMNKEFMQNVESRPEFACLQDLLTWMHSYFRHCPDLLRPCIFYLSIFSKSQAIRRRRLVMRWVAEGYSKDSSNSNAENNGEKIFSKLIDLSMIQPPERTVITRNRMVKCQVNAFFHEYIISRPKQENINFALEVLTLDGSCRHIADRTGRHLVIEKSWERNRTVFESIDFSRLRSLTVFGKWESFFISDNMKVLRVLDLENASDVTDKDFEKIVKWMTRLKFLSLRGCCKISHLPKSLDDLRQLQILDIRHTSIVTLQQSIIKLKKLRYIRAGTNAIPCTLVSMLPEVCRSRQIVGVTVPPGIGKLTLLHTLGVVNVIGDRGKTILKELRNLTQLRKLGVSSVNKNNREEFISAISSLFQLESLSMWLSNDNEGCLEDTKFLPPNNLQSLKIYGLEGQLPGWTAKLGYLRKMHLEITKLKEEYLKPLRNLKELGILRLSFKEPLDGNLVFSVILMGQEVRCYEAIKLLEISCSSNLAVTFGARVMPNLELLQLNCSSLDVTFGSEAMPKLELLQLKGSHDETVLQELRRKLADLPKRPILKLL